MSLYRLGAVRPRQFISFRSFTSVQTPFRFSIKGNTPNSSLPFQASSSPTLLYTARMSTTAALAIQPSLITALEHIPPAPPRSASAISDELTPPPSTSGMNGSSTVQNGVDNDQQPANSAAATTSSDLPPEAEEPKEPEEPVEEVEKVEATPKKGRKAATPRKRAAKTKAAPVEEPNVEAEEGETEEKPKVTPKKRGKKADPDSPLTDLDGGASEGSDFADETPKKKKAKKATPKKPTPKKSRIAKDEPEYDEDGNEIVKKKKKPKVYPKIVYDIPDVERKESTFKGYACLNTVLRGQKPDSIFCSRTCRIASIEQEGMELPKQLGLMNAKDLLTMIEWNEQNKIRFMRMSSEMFPFASHEKYGYSLEYADKELKEAGELARKYGHRLTMHPGQFTQLGSPKPGVIRASIRELEYQCEIMDRMGIDKDGVMIIHMGGVYGDKPSTLARFKENYQKLPDNIRARLVLENDEICYNVDDLFPVCEELNIPIIFDYHHDWINPSSEPPSVLIPRINEMWHKKGIRVKQHLSEPRPGAESVMERRAHADRCQNLPPDLPDDVDLMIEAKDKEQAVFELYRIYGLEDVIYDNLRPADPNPGMHTKGRKSSLKKKVKETGDVDSDGEPIKLEDVEKEGDGEIGDESLVELREVDVKKEKKPAKTRAKRGKKSLEAAEKVEEEEANGENGENGDTEVEMEA